MRKVLRAVITVLLAGIMVFSVLMIIKTMREYAAADKIYESLRSEFAEIKPEEDSDAEDISADDMESDNELAETVPISIDFASLSELNADIVGWLYCSDTPIDYPVVQGKDNARYLHADLNGNYLASGTIFVDYRNGELGVDTNYLVYGHNMKNGTMFASLVKYKEQTYYDEHPVLYYLTPDGDYKIKLYAGLIVDQDSVIYSPNPGKTEFDEFMAYAREHSTFHSDAEITENDILITFSTCSYEYDDARYIIIGRAEKI